VYTDLNFGGLHIIDDVEIQSSYNMVEIELCVFVCVFLLVGMQFCKLAIYRNSMFV
jgi:hypothetical protein